MARIKDVGALDSDSTGVGELG